MEELLAALLPYGIIAIAGSGALARWLRREARQARALRRLRRRISGELLPSVAEIHEGAVLVEGQVRARATIPAPLSKEMVVGHRLIGIAEPGVTAESRFKFCDLIEMRDFDLVDTRGDTLLVRGAAADLFQRPAACFELRLDELDDELAAAIVAAVPPRMAPELRAQHTLYWRECTLAPGCRVFIAGRAARQPDAEGEILSYRELPTRWVIGESGCLVAVGTRDDLASALSSAAFELPREIPSARRGPSEWR